MKKILSLIIGLILFSGYSFSQDDDLMDLLNDEVGEQKIYTAYTFKSTRIINGQSIERMQKNQLDFRVNHRFGEVKAGAYELFGLDNALINLCFEYGITNWWQVGFRRGTYQKTYDFSSKFSLIRQSKGGKFSMPFSLSYFGDMAINTLKINDPNIENKLIHRLSYTHQLLIGTKLNEMFSLQLSPTYVHKNRVAYDIENDVYALGVGGRFKFHRRWALMGEYFYTTNSVNSDTYFPPLAVGFDLETGGHVFQLFVTNSRPMVEHAVITETTGSWSDGGIYFGFNMSRVFAVKSPFRKKHKEH